MSNIKQEEDTEDINCDSWLAYWVDTKKEIKDEEDESSMEVESNEANLSGMSMRGNAASKTESLKQEDTVHHNNPDKEHPSCSVKISTKTKFEVQNVNETVKTRKTAHEKEDFRDIGSSSWEEAMEHAAVSDCIANLCEYRCAKCSRVFTSRQSLIGHFKKTGHACVKEVNINNFLTKIVMHKCQICSRKILSDKQCIKNHLRNKHNINQQEYITKTKVENKCKRSEWKKEFDKRCASDLKNNDISESVGNYCKFSCTRCEFSCKSWQLMTKHLYSKAHGDIISSPLKYLKTLKLHRCYICRKLVLCDNQLLTNHLKEYHKMTLPAYKKNY